MRKLALYTGFAAASGLVAAIFVTTTSYIQLAVAIIFYLPLVYFAFKLFPRKTTAIDPTTQTIPKQNEIEQSESIQPKDKEVKDVEIFDIEKRAFLKLIGATGISFFISSLFTRRFGSLLGREDLGMTKIQDPDGNLINLAKHHPTDNYKISEVDYGIVTYYGFIDQGEGWFIMKEDLDSGMYRYIKGDTNFPDNWNKRENLKYDYFNRVFPKS